MDTTTWFFIYKYYGRMLVTANPHTFESFDEAYRDAPTKLIATIVSGAGYEAAIELRNTLQRAGV
jgi:hypothetical protein